ncbi:MAG TPA: peptidylprolyl isomerase [Xanthomonadales bacterium]|nr:peptidylprolyl isomerase [Xanthomonadales bacterium]
MPILRRLAAVVLGSATLLTFTQALAQAPAAEPSPAPGPTLAQVLAEAAAADWRRPDPENTVYLDLDSGRVILELAPDFAPLHAANIRTLVRAGYFDGLVILRAQDNYVVQWGDPKADDPALARPLGNARTSLPGEFDRSAERLSFTRLTDGDVYAPEVGFSGGFPVGRDPTGQRAWLLHCYGALGVSRGNTADSGNGAGLYVVIGHAPRHLDRNITLAGRVLSGMEHLSVLPRGDGPLGFHSDPARHVPIRSLTLAAQLPVAEREPIEVLRTDTPTFQRLIEARRHRREPWFLDPVGRVEVCNIPIPVRRAEATAP